MSTQRGFVKKFVIIIILAFLLLSTALMSLMYLSPSSTNGSGSLATGADVQSGVTVDSGATVDTASIDSGKVLPTLSKEEASKELQNLLSGVSTTGVTQ